MAYNKANYFKRIVDVQNIVLDEQKRKSDKSLKQIYLEQIQPVYFISYRTFSNYLNINAKAELKKLTRVNSAKTFNR